KDADIIVHAPGNLLIITDSGANIRRMLRILEEIDVGGATAKLWVEPVHYAGAAGLASKLLDVLDLKAQKRSPPVGGAAAGAAASSAGVRVVADERTNALVISATEPDYLRLLELIKRLDVKPSSDSDVRVLALQHASCKEITPTLNQILGGSGASSRPAGAAG